jgi:CheY-like chemotaxis protein
MNDTPSHPLAMIVEDDDKQATIFAQALQIAGFTVEHVSNGRIAQERLAQTLPVLIVLDLHLPEVSGDKLLHQIRSDERLLNTQVILATADPAMADSLTDHSDYIMQKPISFSQLKDLATRIYNSGG